MMTCFLVWFSQAAVLDDAVTWMNTNGLTIFTNTTDYKPNNYIRRDEAAKMYVKLAKLQNKTTYTKTAEQCQFSDLNDAHADLKDIIVESCRLWIFQWSAGKFMPKSSITNEQAVTVLVRILVGFQSETGVTSRSDNYYKKANELWLLSQVSMTDRKISATRGNVGLALATNSDDFSTSSIIEGSFSYPSSWIPDDMIACAVNVATNQEYCSSIMLQNASTYTYWLWFKIPVPDWSYYVYQYSQEIWNSYKWRYTDMVACWLEAWCPQNKIPVTLPYNNANAISDIKPWDWY